MSYKSNKDISGLHFAHFTTQSFLFSFITQFLSLLVGIVTARILGPTGKGIVAIVILYPTLLLTLGHLSVYRALTVRIGEKKYLFADYPGTTMALTVFSSICLMAIFIVVYFVFNRIFIQGVDFYVILISLFILPCSMIMQNFSSILQAKSRIREFNIIKVIQASSLLFMVIIVLLLLHLGTNGVVFAYLFSNLCAGITAIYFVKKIDFQRWKINVFLLKELLSDGIKIHIGVIASFICLRIDMFMLASYRQTNNVGFYSIAVSMAELLMIIPLAIQGVFYSKVSEAINDRLILRERTVAVYKHSLFLLLLASIVFALLARPIIRLFYGDIFLPSILPFMILLPGLFYMWLNNALTSYLIGMKRFFVVSSISTIAAILNVCLNIIFIPSYGAAGAALASTITYILIGTLTLTAFFITSKYNVGDFIKSVQFTKNDLKLYQIVIRRFLWIRDKP